MIEDPHKEEIQRHKEQPQKDLSQSSSFKTERGSQQSPKKETHRHQSLNQAIQINSITYITSSQFARKLADPGAKALCFRDSKRCDPNCGSDSPNLSCKSPLQF